MTNSYILSIYIQKMVEILKYFVVVLLLLLFSVVVVVCVVVFPRPERLAAFFTSYCHF